MPENSFSPNPDPQLSWWEELLAREGLAADAGERDGNGQDVVLYGQRPSEHWRPLLPAHEPDPRKDRSNSTRRGQRRVRVARAARAWSGPALDLETELTAITDSLVAELAHNILPLLRLEPVSEINAAAIEYVFWSWLAADPRRGRRMWDLPPVEPSVVLRRFQQAFGVAALLDGAYGVAIMLS